MVYLQCEAAATQLSMTCDGLVCIPIPGYVNVLNPCTGELLRFPSGPSPVNTSRYDRVIQGASWWDFFPGYWAMGFGKDKVNGTYKIVRMFYDTDQFEILDLNIGKWRTLPNPSPYYVEARHHSAFVNGSIYWFELLHGFKILALDLHTEQFHDVPTPRASPAPAPLVNLEDRLAMVCGYAKYSDAKVDIWAMDTQEETWTKTYSIRLFSSYLCPNHVTMKCIPLMVSKQGNIYFHDSEKKLFKYYPETDQVCCIAKHICVLSPFVENMIPLGHPKTMTYLPGFQYADSWISKLCRRIELPTRS